MAARAARCAKPLRRARAARSRDRAVCAAAALGRAARDAAHRCRGRSSSPRRNGMRCWCSGASWLLTLPAAAMGAGFPLLVAGFAAARHASAAPTAATRSGAAVGALLPLLLLPAVGWTNAVRAVAALNLLVAAGFFVLDRHGQGAHRCSGAPPARRSTRGGSDAGLRPAAVELRRHRRRELAARDGVAAAVQPRHAAHRIRARADPRGDAARHGSGAA